MKRTLLIAPHPDDEVIACGASLAAAAARGETISIVVISDGAQGKATPELRRSECLAGLAELGLDQGCAMFWDYPDGAIPLDQAFLVRLRSQVKLLRPDRILLPSPSEQHADHRRTTRACLLALTGHWQGELWFYETVSPMPVINWLEPCGRFWEHKQAALACHGSQLAQYDYARLCDSLAIMRGVSQGCERAEAFLVFDWDGSPQNFFETTPLLSVVVRASRMPMLHHALASLAAQEYDMLEVVLVWFGEEAPDLTAFPGLHIRIVQGVHNRSDNLNRGIAAADGEYIAILDEDDVLDPEHYANLITELRADARIDLAYSRTRLRQCELVEGGVLPGAVLDVLGEPASAARLLLGNVIPIHAFVCRTSLLRGYPFDAALHAYEDWDVIASMALDGRRFAQIDAVSAEYRLFDQGASLSEVHQARGYESWRQAVRHKLIARLQSHHLDELLSNLLALQAERDRELLARHGLQEQVALLQQAGAQAAALAAALADYSARALVQSGAPQSTLDAGSACAALALARSGPRFTIVMPVFNTDAALLEEAVQSVLDQAYPNWVLCLVNDGSTTPATLACLDRLASLAQGEQRLRIRHLDGNCGIVAASNAAVALDDAPWISFVDHDDRLHPAALFELALALMEQPAARLAYTDSRMIDRAGALLNTFHKPDWSPALLLSINYLNHLTAIDRSLFEEIGGLQPRYQGSQDYAMVLACARRLGAHEVVHINKPLYDWRTTETSVSYNPAQKPECKPAAALAVADHLRELGLAGATADWRNDYPGVVAGWAAPAMAVHIVIPTHANASGLTALLDALLGTEGTQWRATVVLNRCRDGYAQALRARLADERRIEWLVDERPFNWSALNNRAAVTSNEEALLFLNDDVLPQQADWLARMLRYLALPGVGVVGARLHYPDGGLQHIGIVLDPDQVAHNLQDVGRRHERVLTREVSAVTGAAMLVARPVFDAVGGFDPHFAVNYNDVDFCIHARALGWGVVMAMDVALLHAESSTRITATDDPVLLADGAAMRGKWPRDALLEKLDSRYTVEFSTTRILHVGGAD
ncbi:glycosyltransferase [Chitinimonas sp.]|uniref:glycosyltransferase n=1 Tax=Chitinimonas sp. TaxID=1934313 RepID=UPI0035B02B6A